MQGDFWGHFSGKICLMRHELQGISGNEAVDRLSKEGATAIPFSVGKKNSSRSIKPGGLSVLAANSQKSSAW
jgi:hypothetical protein